MDSYDVVVVGAGSAGSATTYFCAQYGLKALCIDQKQKSKTGAQWVNAIPATVFPKIGLEAPSGDEKMGADVPFHLIAGYGPEKLVLRNHGNLEVDMRRLNARLQNLAESAGGSFSYGTRCIANDGEILETSKGRVRFKWLIDASGFRGASLLGRDEIDTRHICAAAQEVCKIQDLDQAVAYFKRHNVPWGETLCFSGIFGGYSVLNLRAEGETISILTGSIPGEGHPSGRKILDRFKAEEAWIGTRCFGGARTIPLRRPSGRIANATTALVGDAARQVFSAHGSGVGLGLLAARLVADTLATTQDLHDYEKSWYKKYGSLLHSADAFRIYSQDLQVEHLKLLIREKILDEEMAAAGLRQELPSPALSDLVPKGRALARRPHLSAQLASVFVHMLIAELQYARYPDSPTEAENWTATLDSLDTTDRKRAFNFMRSLIPNMRSIGYGKS
jgi:menaquinone-9 beta-reductase